MKKTIWILVLLMIVSGTITRASAEEKLIPAKSLQKNDNSIDIESNNNQSELFSMKTRSLHYEDDAALHYEYAPESPAANEIQNKNNLKPE